MPHLCNVSKSHPICGPKDDSLDHGSSLKVGVDHIALHDGMFIHVGIMDRGIQNDLYTIMLSLSFMLNVENRGCLVIVNVGIYWMHAMDDPKVVSGYFEYEHDEEV